MIYGAYQNVRDAAWQCLIDFHITALPTDLIRVVTLSGIKIVKNSDVNILEPSQSGACMIDGDTWYLIYNDQESFGRRRFTIAHELGHVFLGHMLGGRQFVARKNIGEPFETDDPEETAANRFAARFIAPACALWGLDLHAWQDIQRCAKLSDIAAQYRAERMELLYQRNRFLSHPLERAVYRQMLPWIQSIRPDAPTRNRIWII